MSTELEKLRLIMLWLKKKDLSKNEIRVLLYCLEHGRTSAEISDQLNFASPNTARLLIKMVRKSYLTRRLRSNSKAYIYLTNLDNPDIS
ncbi:MarR family transcriptional regulator [Holzapfeliella floricola]|uniref:MarR family transcriptional regulator n=1 Tax=Holzapfeliella floricola TaxID=679249 RepID=UPI0007055B67|nr:MarR family transcriptional regulator [Holzapfeliella floricola]